MPVDSSAAAETMLNAMPGSTLALERPALWQLHAPRRVTRCQDADRPGLRVDGHDLRGARLSRQCAHRGGLLLAVQRGPHRRAGVAARRAPQGRDAVAGRVHHDDRGRRRADQLVLVGLLEPGQPHGHARQVRRALLAQHARSSPCRPRRPPPARTSRTAAPSAAARSGRGPWTAWATASRKPAGSSVSSERKSLGGADWIWPSTCCASSPVTWLNFAAVAAGCFSLPG